MSKLKPENLQPFKGGWVPPDGEAIKEVLKEANLSGRKAADLLGFAEDKTIRRWTSGEYPIPYSAWAILCAMAGHGQIW